MGWLLCIHHCWLYRCQNWRTLVNRAADGRSELRCDESFMISGGTVFLNIGGSIHQVKWETIDKFPKSRLQRLRFATTESNVNTNNHQQSLYTLSKLLILWSFSPFHLFCRILVVSSNYLLNIYLDHDRVKIRKNLVSSLVIKSIPRRDPVPVRLVLPGQEGVLLRQVAADIREHSGPLPQGDGGH